jgi:hypothetical protein
LKETHLALVGIRQGGLYSASHSHSQQTAQHNATQHNTIQHQNRYRMNHHLHFPQVQKSGIGIWERTRRIVGCLKKGPGSADTCAQPLVADEARETHRLSFHRFHLNPAFLCLSVSLSLSLCGRSHSDSSSIRRIRMATPPRHVKVT